MFKQILSVAVIALVSTSEAARLHRNRNIFAQSKNLNKIATKARAAQDFPDAITLKEAEWMVEQVDANGDHEVTLDELKPMCGEWELSKSECNDLVEMAKHCDTDKSESVSAPELMACVNEALTHL